jgi:hypothetical protein
VAKGFT